VRGQRHAPAASYPRERPGTHFTGCWWASGSVWTGAIPTTLPGPLSRNTSFWNLYAWESTVILVKLFIRNFIWC